MEDSGSKKEGNSPSETFVWDQYTQRRRPQSTYQQIPQPAHHFGVYMEVTHQARPQQQQQPEAQYAPSLNAGGAVPHSSSSSSRKFDRSYSLIADSFTSLEQVTEDLARTGLESSNLIVGIDFTKSNEWTATTHDKRCQCHWFEEVLKRYREIVPHIRLSGVIFISMNN